VAWSKVFTFTDPFEYQAAIRGADFELYPTARGKFRAELTQVTLDRLWMQRFDENLPRVHTGTVRPGRRVIGFLTDAEQQGMQFRGLGVSPGEIMVDNFEVIHQRTEGSCRFGSMSLPLDDLDAACKAITGRECSGTSPKQLIRPSPALFWRLSKLHKLLGQMAKTAPDIFLLIEVVRALEHELAHLMVRCLTEGMPSNTPTGVLRHEIIVGRFEEFLEANPDQPLYLTEICAAIGVAERTLRMACEEHLGMGPIRYLTLRRMHLVRRALLRAAPPATVTQIVTDHGFWELGRFSVAYRNLFGEAPSVTLKRPPELHRISLNRPSSLVSSDKRKRAY
jgi:AraC-like DNA-binding protein